MFQKLQTLRQGNRSVDEYATDFFKMIKRITIQDSGQPLVMHFIGGLQQQIQVTRNLFQPQSISEAHQQAITVETQIRGGFQSFGSNKQSRQSTTATAPTHTDAKTETTTAQTTQANQQKTTGLRCFSCGEAGHRQSACPSRNRRGLLIEYVTPTDEPIYDEDHT